MLLAGDVGGTKTDLAIYSNESGPHSPLAETEVHSADYPSLQAMVKEFLGQVKNGNIFWIVERSTNDDCAWQVFRFFDLFSRDS